MDIFFSNEACDVKENIERIGETIFNNKLCIPAIDDKKIYIDPAIKFLRYDEIDVGVRFNGDVLEPQYFPLVQFVRTDDDGDTFDWLSFEGEDYIRVDKVEVDLKMCWKIDDMGCPDTMGGYIGYTLAKEIYNNAEIDIMYVHSKEKVIIEFTIYGCKSVLEISIVDFPKDTIEIIEGNINHDSDYDDDDDGQLTKEEMSHFYRGDIL